MSFMWSDELKNKLRKQLNSTDVLNEMDKLFDSSSETEIESLVNNFTNVIVNSSKKVVCVRNGQVSRKKQRNTVQKQKWFDRNCHSFKKELRNLGSDVEKNGSFALERPCLYGELCRLPERPYL